MGHLIDMANSTKDQRTKIWAQNSLSNPSEDNFPIKSMQRYVNEPSAIEIYKYWLSLEADQLANSKDYIKAAKTKLKLAQICKYQNKKDDCYKLEDSAHKLIITEAEGNGHYREAAELLNEWATELRKNGQERDAFLLDTTAYKYKNMIRDP